MATSSDDPLASATEGVTKGFLSWTEDKLKDLVKRFHNREIAFIEDPETIDLAKKQRKTSEWGLFIEYIDDSDLRILFQMGLTLRKLEGNQKQLESLRGKILNKYNAKGLHIAQFIQNGFFGKFIGNILVRASTPQRLKFEIENLLNNIERTCVFVKSADDVDKITEEIVTKILANSPDTFIICSSGSAMKKCEKIEKKVMDRISGYVDELYKTEIKEIYFINKISELP